jgi:hypothetical protein
MATRNAGGDGGRALPPPSPPPPPPPPPPGGGTEPMTRPAAVHPNASSHTRPDVPPMLLGKLAMAAPGPACPENTAEVPARDLCTRSPRDLVHVLASRARRGSCQYPGRSSWRDPQ